MVSVIATAEVENVEEWVKPDLRQRILEPAGITSGKCFTDTVRAVSTTVEGQAQRALESNRRPTGDRKSGREPSQLPGAVMKNRAHIAAISLTLAGVLAGCASPGASPPGAPATQSRPSGASAPAAAHMFSSRLYGYTVALPAGWSAQPGQRWGGTGAPGPVDVFRGPPYVAAWAFAVPRPANPAAYATAITRTAAQLPCPAAPQTSQAITIDGVPTRLIGMRCPAPGGVLMLTAVTTRGQSALVVTFEDSSGVSSGERADRAAFREFLTGTRLRA